MGHLVSTIRNTSLADTAHALADAHTFIVERAHKAVAQVPTVDPAWGSRVKRLEVELAGEGRPFLVAKSHEKLAEVVNMLATLERLTSAVRWFARHPEFSLLHVSVCHPTTSAVRGDNDLVLTDDAGTVRVRCEVCDVVSGSAGQNGKERTDLANLGCATGVPDDGIRRFVSTASEFAAALTSEKRRWDGVAHRYVAHHVEDGTGTVLLELVPRDTPLGSQPMVVQQSVSHSSRL
jgi:hypothetical protein